MAMINPPKFAILLKSMSFRSLGDDVLGALVRSLHEEARKKSVSIEFFDRELDIQDFIKSRTHVRFDAIIGSIPASEPAAVSGWHRLERLKPTVLMLSEPFERSPFRNYVGCDEELAIGLVVDHLIEEGAQRIGYCSFGCESFSKRRFNGFLNAMERHHRKVEQHRVNAFDVSSGEILRKHRLRASVKTDEERAFARREIYRSFLSQKSPPDAILCEGDRLATELAAEAARTGFAVPRQLMIAGFDNSRSYLGKKPIITSVDQNFGLIARTAFVTAMEIVDHRRNPHGNEVLVTPRILIRASTIRRTTLIDSPAEKKLERAIKDLLGRHFSDPSASNAIAARLGLSPNYFLRRYRELFGKPFIRALNEFRIAKAALSLRITGKSITRIFLENGYSNHIHFNKMFKRAYGKTARAFRKSYKKN